ncbi:ATP F0F1 synthase subunit B [Roseibium denhamense]|uniref:ATP synthase subunit b n=1 Tax=Roseibium denhamense TaxID=76305 RepID=A0ABY1P4H6_9HYPH|nr:ATP F0F1 synthase subunit B [Roseibium denhamense]SMP25320.1 F-type H+-transporting ATPase subunit b [Roseibium denhamense]
MDASFWALVGLILFFALIAYLKVPGMITGALDKRADDIKKELEEARKMREEAQELLSGYQRKRHEAESEAEAIVAEANAEAERLTVETNEALEEMIARRSKAAEDKIAQAESQAIAEVRAKAADIAATAAEHILTAKVKDKVADDILAKSIDQVKAKLN